jgi:hypothetical protein
MEAQQYTIQPCTTYQSLKGEEGKEGSVWKEPPRRLKEQDQRELEGWGKRRDLVEGGFVDVETLRIVYISCFVISGISGRLKHSH